MAGPSATFALPVYNQERYVGAAIAAALAQAHTPLEILISDDCSSDGSWAVIEAAVAGYGGPHQITLNRNAERLGLDHFNLIAEKAQGDILVFAQGDDISTPSRAALAVAAMETHRVAMVTSNALLIDGDGKAMGLTCRPDQEGRVTLEEIVNKGWTPRIMGSTLVWHRDLFRRFGPLDRNAIPFGVDHILPFRATLLTGIYFLGRPLLRKRMHQDSATYTMIDRVSGPAEHQESVAAHDVTNYLYMLRTVRELLQHQPGHAGLVQLEAGLKERIVARTANWVMHRNRLRLEGRRAYWLDQRPPNLPPPSQDYRFTPAVPIDQVLPEILAEMER